MASNVQDHGFQRKGQAWFCTTGLPSDIIVEVGEMSFHLHKFPLMSRSGKLEKLVAEAESHEDGFALISLPDIPGGAEAFEMAAKFCYGVRAELTAGNVVSLRCAAEFLEMTEDIGDGNLIVKCEHFLNHVVLRSWKDSVTALQSSEKLLPAAEELHVVKRCVDSIVTKACENPSFFGWPVTGDAAGAAAAAAGSMQSPGGSLLWNGINTGVIPLNSRTDWWYEDLCSLSLPLYKRVISAMVAKGLQSENIAGALTHYAKKWLPGLNRRRRAALPAVSVAMSEREQKELLETIESLLPEEKGATSTGFLFGLLRTAMILNAGVECRSRLERRIGGQLEEAVIEHLLIPNYSHKSETLYDVGCIRRIVDHFVGSEPPATAAHFPDSTSPLIASPSITPIMLVSKLIDGYLAEVASDANLKPLDFQALAAALPDYARLSDDGLYRAIDIYVKAHPWLTEKEREEISGVMDCEKLTVEACMHASQNERMPLRVIVQVLCHEQLQLRTAIAGCFLAGEGSEDSTRTPPYGLLTQVTGSIGEMGVMRENEALKIGMASMQCKVRELEGECSSMRHEMEKLKGDRKGGALSKKLWCTLMPQICESHEALQTRGLRRRRKGRSLPLDASQL